MSLTLSTQRLLNVSGQIVTNRGFKKNVIIVRSLAIGRFGASERANCRFKMKENKILPLGCVLQQRVVIQAFLLVNRGRQMVIYQHTELVYRETTNLNL